jgi:hypothetical protein
MCVFFVRTPIVRGTTEGAGATGAEEVAGEGVGKEQRFFPPPLLTAKLGLHRHTFVDLVCPTKRPCSPFFAPVSKRGMNLTRQEAFSPFLKEDEEQGPDEGGWLYSVLNESRRITKTPQTAIQSDRDALPFWFSPEKGVLAACREGGSRKGKWGEKKSSLLFLLSTPLQRPFAQENDPSGTERREKGEEKRE